MRLALAAFTAALLTIGSAPVQAQDAAGTTAKPETSAAEPVPTSNSAAVPPKVSPKTRKKLLQDLLNAIAQPRPVAPTAGPAEQVTPKGTPDAGAASPIPPPPRPATGIALTPAVTTPVPRPAAAVVPKPRPTLKPTELTLTPRPVPHIAPIVPVEPPPVAEPGPPIAPLPVPVPTMIEPANPPPMPPTTAPAESSFASNFLLAGLLAALAAVAAAVAMRVQRARRIERTRAALAVIPRIDLAAGGSAIDGLSLAGPPLTIRARLAT